MKLEQVTEIISQKPDCCSDESLMHQMEVKTSDGGGGPYVVIKTERWAMDLEDIAEFTDYLTEFLEKAEARMEVGPCPTPREKIPPCVHLYPED